MTEKAQEMALKATEIRVALGGRDVLRGIDVTVAAGEIVGLLGPSGSGKSTFFRVVAGDLSHEGTIHLGGAAMAGLPLHLRARKGLGYMPQGASVLWDLTVAENLKTFASVALGASWSRETIIEKATAVGLGERLDVPVVRLSGGERRRLEFARALTRSPRLIVCDEPFAGVDPVGASQLSALLVAAAKGGAGVLLADHHVEEALAICDRALLLLDGAVAVSGSPEAFRADALVASRYLAQRPVAATTPKPPDPANAFPDPASRRAGTNAS